MIDSELMRLERAVAALAAIDAAYDEDDDEEAYERSVRYLVSRCLGIFDHARTLEENEG